MRVLIMGCGGVGARVATNLWRAGNEVVVLDTNPDSFRHLSEDLKRHAIVADGTRREDLVAGGIEEADVFIAVASSDSANAMASQMAKHTFGVDKVVCRINDPASYAMYIELGLDAVSATQEVSYLIVGKVGG